MKLPAELPMPEPVLGIVRTLEAAGHEAWCVGGAIRDALLGSPVADVDIATSATPPEVQQLFRRTIAVGVRFGTVGVLDAAGALHEVTTFRKDVETDGRHAVVEYGASLDEDLARRDFTINAIAYHPLRHEWRDRFGGVDDLERGVVRAVGVAAERFREDYLRILRAVRFASRFGFALDADTLAAAVALSDGLSGLSAERVHDEWTKALASVPDVPRLVALWHETGAARVWLPELRPAAEAATLAVPPPGAGRDAVVLTAALVRAGAPVFRRLKASGREIARAAAIDAGPAAPAAGDARSVRHWLAATGDAADDLRAVAALRAGADPAWGAGVDGVRARGEATSRAALAVAGADLIAAGIPPGPALGAMLGTLLERVLDDPSVNTRDRLLALARTRA